MGVSVYTIGETKPYPLALDIWCDIKGCKSSVSHVEFGESESMPDVIKRIRWHFDAKQAVTCPKCWNEGKRT